MKGKQLLYTLVGIAALVILFMGLRKMFAHNEGFVSDGNTFTLYYAEWCPHCKAVKPVFKDWSSSGTVTVNGKTVSANMVEADTNPELVSAAGVKGFPTMLLKKADGTTIEYKGDRTPSAWEGWIGSNM
jgi:thiol-disulfide isomerase/thioredoxin